MATIVFRFMIGSNVLIEAQSNRLSLLKRTVQGQLEFKNPSLHVANLMHALQTH